MTQVSTEENGRYTEIYVEGFPDGSLAYDKKENELIINATDWRVAEQANLEHRLVAEMPDPLTEGDR
jgi:hypothetical protein